MPKLIITGTPHELVEESITIGRSPDNFIQIDDASVSGHHVELRLTENNYHLRDLGSTNGTRVNGVVVRETLLRNGDRISFGAVQARYEAEIATSAAPQMPEAKQAEAQIAEHSARPADFDNASPFRAHRTPRDPGKMALFVAAVIGFLALLAALVAVFTIRPPAP
jgi:predicted component of type VI protein secretion system